jgi:hypothetical protein
MSEVNGIKQALDKKNELPILPLNSLRYAKINGNVPEAMGARLNKYGAYATKRM